MLGIDINRSEYYEGASNHGAPLAVRPLLLPMTLTLGSNELPHEAKSGNYISSQLFFRELSYDAVAHTRRGTCYRGNDSQPTQWVINGAEDMGLVTFVPQRISHQLKASELAQPLACLGLAENFTVAQVNDIETLVTGDEIITLKLRRSFGVIPDLDRDMLTNADFEVMALHMQKVRDSYSSALPESTVDRCRDAATQAFGIYTEQPTKDLGNLIRLMNNATPRKRIADAAGEILRVFHSRVKPSEKAKWGDEMPELLEQDAELAVRCLGAIIRELGYGKWPATAITSSAIATSSTTMRSGY